jgi:cobalt/nickel transport system ATP-binding protein
MLLYCAFLSKKMEDIIRLENITFHYVRKHCALADVSLAVKPGEIFSIIGSNGSGKSTLLHIIGGLLFPDTGKVFYKREVVSEESLKRVAFNSYFRESMGYVFQDSDNQLFCPTVFDELIFAPLQMGIEKASAFERAEAVMVMLNIECLSDRPTYMLSGGEKKRVAIGSILTMNPDVLLMDEPTSGLDPKSRSSLIELIFQLNNAGKTILLTTHNLELVDHLQSRVAVLSEEHKIEKIGNAEEILTDTELLIRTNLIHEHLHRHGTTSHKHLPPSFLSHHH